MRRGGLRLGILNGGASSRMGRPKSLLLYKGKPLVEHIYSEALKVVEEPVILGESPLPAALQGVKVLPDFGVDGPLGAVRAAINYSESDWFFWAVDMPLLKAEHIFELLLSCAPGSPAAVPYHGDAEIYEPYFAYYSREILLKINGKLKKTIYSMKKLLKYYNIEGNSDFASRYKEELKSWNYPEDIKS